MDREILAAHLALKGGVAIKYAGEYSLFIPGYRIWWVGSLNPWPASDWCDLDTLDSSWSDRVVHPRDIPDPFYDQLVEVMRKEGAL